MLALRYNHWLLLNSLLRKAYSCVLPHRLFHVCSLRHTDVAISACKLLANDKFIRVQTFTVISNCVISLFEASEPLHKILYAAADGDLPLLTLPFVLLYTGFTYEVTTT